MKNKASPASPADFVDVGGRVQELRAHRKLSVRRLAELSGLNVNTISLIENGRTSPSVSTLQQIAAALEVPMAAFFDRGASRTQLVFQKSGQHPCAGFTHGTLHNLGAGMARKGLGPFMVALLPGAGSGETLMSHAGLELVFCLEGRVQYTVRAELYAMQPGDSLLFEAHLPHRWHNPDASPARFLLVLCSSGQDDYPGEIHFSS